MARAVAPQGHADADFTPADGDPVGKQPVDSERGKQRTQYSEERDQENDEAARLERVIDPFLHRFDVIDWQIVIDPGDDALYIVRERTRGQAASKDERGGGAGEVNGWEELRYRSL